MNAMENKKFIFILSRASKNPIEAVGLMRIAANMKTFDESCEIDFFLIDEAVLIAKKGFAETITVQIEEQTISLGELLNTLIGDFKVKFYVCPMFMPAFGVKKEDLIENAEIKPSSHLGELLLEGRIPFSLSL